MSWWAAAWARWTPKHQRGRHTPGRRDPEPHAGQPHRAGRIAARPRSGRGVGNRTEHVRLPDPGHAKRCHAHPHPGRRADGTVGDCPQGRGTGRARRRAENHAASPGAKLRRHDAPLRPRAAVAHRADASGNHGHRQGPGRRRRNRSTTVCRSGDRMKHFRSYRFPPLSQFIAAGQRAASEDTDGQWQASVSEGFEQGQRDGYEVGLVQGQQDGYDSGRSDGVVQGREVGRNETLVALDRLARPVDAILRDLKKVRADYRAAQRKEVVDLVAKVARQVIRAELALQPVQLLALVDETLASMPPTREEIDVYLNPEELKRISELDPKRAKRWNLIADARLDAGECRIKAGDNEVDAGCHQRLSACMDQVSSHLALAAEHADQSAPA